jgi:hypothetical protein
MAQSAAVTAIPGVVFSARLMAVSAPGRRANSPGLLYINSELPSPVTRPTTLSSPFRSAANSRFENRARRSFGATPADHERVRRKVRSLARMRSSPPRARSPQGAPKRTSDFPSASSESCHERSSDRRPERPTVDRAARRDSAAVVERYITGPPGCLFVNGNSSRFPVMHSSTASVQQAHPPAGEIVVGGDNP